MVVAGVGVSHRYDHASASSFRALCWWQTAHPVLRKPLIIMAPKGLLRDARLASPLDDFLPGKVLGAG